MILIIDNYDSFTNNIVCYINQLGIKTQIVFNDISYSSLKITNYDAIIFSPGPSRPENSGICPQLLEDCIKQKIPLLGICLGMQIIAQYFGYKIQQCEEYIHGKSSLIKHNKNNILFKNIPTNFYVGRYHSLSIQADKNYSQTIITCHTTDKQIPMALEHKELPIFAIQFHPESILTEYGYQILANFLKTFTLNKNIELIALSLDKKIYEQYRPK